MGETGSRAADCLRYVSPDHSIFIPAGDDFVKGQLYYGTKMANILRAFSLAQVPSGHPFYISDESDEKTFQGHGDAGEAIDKVDLFAEQGGESVAQDKDGNVYLAAGQILVYGAAGNLKEKIDVPERPIDLVFGGPDGRTLYILTHRSLYAIRTNVSGLR